MPPDLRRIVAFLALPLAAGLHAAGWYGGRSVMFIHFTDAGLSTVDIGTMLAATSVTVVLGTVTGAVLALGVGPGASAAAGFAGLAGGLALMPVLPGPLGVVALGIASFGHGMTRPTLVAAAVRPFRRTEQAARVSVIALILAALNAGALAGPAVLGELYGPLATRWLVFLAAASACVGAGVLAAAVAAVDLAAEPDAPDVGSSERLDGRVFGTALLLALGLGVGWTAYTIGAGAQGDLLYRSAATPPWIYAVNPVSVASTSLVLALVFAVVQVLRLPLPTLVPAGAGLMLVGACIAASLLPPAIRDQLPVVAGLFMLTGVGEALCMAPIVARVGGEVHWRLSAVALAFLFGPALASNLVVSRLMTFLAEVRIDAAPLVVIGCAAVCGLAGAITLLGAWPLERMIAPAPESGDGDAG